MNLTEHYPSILYASLNLVYSYDYISTGGDTPYKVKGLKLLREIIISLEPIEVIHSEISEIKNSWVFQTGNDELLVSGSSHNIQGIVNRLRIKVDLLRDIIESSGLIGNSDLLFIRLPDFKSFDDLARYSNSLKKAIELPLNEISEEPSIIGADKGSVILYINVGSSRAVNLVAQLCWSAAVLRRKRKEVELFTEQMQDLDLDVSIMTQTSDAQKKKLSQILESEAISILNKENIETTDSETLRRFELSINTLAEIIDKGGRILPMSNNNDVIKTFPDYNALNLIESSIRQLDKGQNGDSAIN